MSAERPARKPSSEPPDVDSLMSRLDGESDGERISDPGGERRPSAAELLGGRGKRAKRTIRVPDDAVPAATPPSTPGRRSAPPMPAAPPVAPQVADQLLRSSSFLPEAAVRSQRIISVGGPGPSQPMPSSPTPPVSAPVPTSEPTPIAPAVAAIAPGVLTPLLDPISGAMPAVGAASDVRLAAASPSAPIVEPTPVRRSAPPPPPSKALRTPPPFTSPFLPGAAGPSSTSNVGGDAGERRPPGLDSPSPAPISVPSQPIPASAPAQPVAVAPVQSVAVAPAQSVAVAPAQPVATVPLGSAPPEHLKSVTLPNLDAQVKEALALLDREDFETSIDISVQDEEPTNPAAPRVELPIDVGPASEESLGDEELEVVHKPEPSKKVVTAPNPPPRKASLPGAQSTSIITPSPTAISAASPHTLPSATAAEPSAHPSIVVAAAATAVSAPAAAPIAPAATPPPAAAAPGADSAEIRKKKRQWFEELFNDDYARTLPRVDARFLDREVGFIEESLGCEKGAAILDLGCGPGEQAVALAARGYEVIGIDLSLAMLARAADEATEKGQRINFLQGDMRDLTFDEAFDGIYCWNTTFGYFDDAKNAEVVQKIHKALRRGGRFLLDIANRDYIVPRTPSMVWFEGEGCVCMDEVQLNAINSRLVVKRTMMMEDGRQREIEYTIRLYALHELGKLLHDNGFRVAEASGDTSTPGHYFGSESPRILILAEKR
ncbi:MAG: methyltransferase domain-containing protein [Deltaproteobacteria bacterium]|nr:methyltransferase domain-containing protein [Deltaproteobacteria bacterium]